MKMMKRFTSILLVLCMVLSLVPAITLGASAAESAVISFAGGDESSCDGIPFTDATSSVAAVFAKNNHTTPPKWYGTHVRFYGTTNMTNTLTISVPNGYSITKIEFSFTSSSYNMENAIANSGTLADDSWTGNAQSVVFTTTKQVRLVSATITYGASSDCNHANTSSTVTTPATCEAAGVTTYTCADCGDTWTKAEPPANGHSWGEPVETTAPGCLTAGENTLTCTACGSTTKEAVSALGHNYVDGICTRCSANQEEATTYKLVTHDAVTAGNYIIGAVRGGTYPTVYPATSNIKGNTDTDWYVSESYVTATGDEITSDLLPSDAQVFTLSGDNTNGFTVSYTDASGTVLYLGYTEAANRKLAFGTGYSTTLWKVVADTDGGVALTAVGTQKYTISQNSNSSSAIRGYANSTIYTGIYLFCEDAPATSCTHANTSTTTVDATCTAAGSTTVTCDDCGHVVSTTTTDALGHSYTNGYCTVCGAADPDSSTTGMIRASIKIITGSGKAWFKDSAGIIYALTDDSGNALGSEATEKAKVYRALVPIDGQITLVLQPDADQRLACIEQNSSRLATDAYSYDGQYFTYTFTAKDDSDHSGVNNYFRITFLPRLSDGGYTAEQATETNVGDKITAGLYVMTGISGLEDLTTNAHSVDTTYLLYADEYTVLDDGTKAVGRKSSALQLASVGVSLNADAPYRMTAINKKHLIDIQPYGDTGYYTMELAGARGYYLKGKDENNLFTATKTESGIEDEALWTITYLGDGAYEIINKAHTNRYLRFNSTATNLQFRAYQPNDDGDLTGHAPVLYRATKVSQLVTYSVASGTGTGSIYANNNSTASAVASGTYQTIDSVLTFTFTPAFGYQLDSVTVNGTAVEVNEDGTYTCIVEEGTDIHVEASYEPISATNKITVYFYVNGEEMDRLEPTVANSYVLDLSTLDDVTVVNPVTNIETTYSYEDLSFSLSQVERENAVVSTYYDLLSTILVQDDDVIRAYFTTTEVTLSKTAIETTDKNTTVNDKNGGLNLENFTDSNDMDTHGNVQQTFEITLNAQSFSTGADKVEGNTDVILVLDNSNSMHHKDSGSTTSGYLSACSSTADSLSIVEELDSNSIWTIRFIDGVATVRTVGAYTHDTLGFDATNKVFGAYTYDNSLVGVTLWRYDETANNNAGGWANVTSEDQLASGDLVAILDAETTNYGMNNYINENGQFTTVDTSTSIPSATTFTLAKSSYEDTFIYAFSSAEVTLAGKTNSEYTLAALDKFYDTVFSIPGNRVGVVKFETEAFAWNGSSFVAYNGSQNPSNYSLTYENCFMSTKAAAQAASDAAIANQETAEKSGATNMVGAWLMTYTMCNLFDGTNGRNLVIVFFTDGVPTATYVTDDEGYWSSSKTAFQPGLSTRTFTESAKVYAGHGTTTSGTLAAGTYDFIHGGSGGSDTSAVEYSDALYLAQAVRSKLETRFGDRFAIHNIGLFNEAASEDEQIEYPELIANLLCAREYDSNGNLSNQTKQWNNADYPANSQTQMTDVLYIPEGDTYYHYIRSTDDPVSYYNYADAGAYLNDSTKWVNTDPYADSYVSVTGNVDAELKDAFDSIAVSITPGKKVQGTIEDTIPAGFKLTNESQAKLEADGWTVTDNDDGTTTIVKTDVIADADGESFTYEIEYQGDGYGAVYTNVQAKYIYEGVDEENEYVSYFPMPVVEVIPWTVNDGYTADTNVAVTLDVMKNDLFEELTAGGYIVSNLTVTLTDANGMPTSYLGAQTGSFDAVVDPASNTVSFVTEVGGTHTFYYVVSAKVTAPDGTVTTVYSRATRVDVLTVSVETVSDVDVIAVGETGSANILANDTYASGTNDAGNNVVLTDANGNELTSSTIGILTGVSVDKETGVLTYTAAESGVQQFWYVNTVTVTDSNGSTISVSTPPTKVTILVVDDAVLVVDYGYTTEVLQAHADLTAYTVADGVTLASVVDVTYPVNVNGTYGTANFNNGAFTFTPATTMFGGLDIFNYTVKITKNTYNVRTATYEPTVTVVPANSVHYEESFLNYATTGVDLNGKALTTWTNEGTADTRDQSTANKLYGYDSVYAAIESYSGNSAKVATVTKANPTAVAYFNFTGTGFDLYGLSSQDTGFLLAEIYTYDASAENNLGTIKQYVMVDTYIQGKTYEQLPILCFRDLPYGNYAVKLRVVYEEAFDHNLPATRNEGIKNEDYYRQLLGLQAGVPMELSLNETKAPATRTVPTAAYGSYSIVLDGIRIYQPLDANPEDPTAAQLYEAAGETGLSFFRIRDLLLSYGKWADTDNTVSGLVYIAASDLNGGISDKPEVDESESVYLTPTQSFVLEKVVDEETEKTYHYLIDAETGARATYVDEADGKAYEIYVTVVETVDDNGKPGWANEFRYEKDGEEIVISADWVQEQGFMRLKNYYEAIGPKYELYLTNGNGIAFTATADQLLHLSMKVPEGERATLQAYVNGQWVDAVTVTSRTEMYYDLSEFVNSDGSVMIRCSAAEGTVLSLCNIKTASDITVTRRSIRLAAAAFEGPVVENGDGFKMGHSVSFESDLKMNYRIKYSALAELVPNYVAEGAYLVVEKDRYFANGETAVETVTLTADLSSDPDRMIFVLDGIQSVEMGSELRATLHFFDTEGKEHTSPVDTYSVLAYAKECFQNSTDTRLYTMVIDLLNYGAAAQLHFNRNAANPVNAGLDAYQKYASTALSAELSDEMTVAGGTATAVSKIGFAVNFADRTEIKVKLSLAEGYTAEDITSVKVLDENGNVVEVLTDLAEIEDGKLEATFSGVTSVCMRRMYYFVAYSADQAVSETVGFSVEAYVKGAMDPAKVSFTELLIRCIYYGDAAEAYFKD